MQKIKIKAIITLTDQKITENVIGSIESGIISYQENNNTYVYLDTNKDELIRENNEITLKYIFDESKTTKGNIMVKELNQELALDIKTNKIEKENNRYKVEYEVENNVFYYELKYWEV